MQRNHFCQFFISLDFPFISHYLVICFSLQSCCAIVWKSSAKKRNRKMMTKNPSCRAFPLAERAINPAAPRIQHIAVTLVRAKTSGLTGDKLS
ncbi:hypothetical protein K450DRAFT_232125 [Umbelopsis ramanniana AG]|uniref:Uncharacterized protein n=1 Tax=Umbelopsis ramanniana AG TaxID=1314678 RepID=A0AAD5ECW9_UMBRA|nr:uncharacterized protein K450DRAFT_232125 [Umbelopsis ramanniana AG]KAI8581608.1 hypothetical protein K450DRAFT_232125 [Umbelopsis ramanniana AG]